MQLDVEALIQMSAYVAPASDQDHKMSHLDNSKLKNLLVSFRDSNHTDQLPMTCIKKLYPVEQDFLEHYLVFVLISKPSNEKKIKSVLLITYSTQQRCFVGSWHSINHISRKQVIFKWFDSCQQIYVQR